MHAVIYKTELYYILSLIRSHTVYVQYMYYNTCTLHAVFKATFKKHHLKVLLLLFNQFPLPSVNPTRYNEIDISRSFDPI